MLHRLCEPPSISFEFQPCDHRLPRQAALLPVGASLRLGEPIGGAPYPVPIVYSLGLPGYLIPFATLAFASQRQKTSQDLAFATGVPSDLNAFHRSTGSSRSPYVPPDGAFRAPLSPVEPGTFSIRRPHPPTRALSPVIPNNVRTVRLTVAAGTNLARASSRDRVKVTPFLPSTGVYNPKAFILHAASLGQACAHCRRFSTAASRRSLGSVSVPVCRATLARPVGIRGLVGHYPANYLIPRRPVPRHARTLVHTGCPVRTSLGIYPQFPRGYAQPWGWLPSPYSPLRH